MLEADGWFLVRTNGSHRVFQQTAKTNSVVVPVHGLGNDIPKGLQQAILKHIAVDLWRQDMQARQQPMPAPSTEVVSIEVAAC